MSICTEGVKTEDHPLHSENTTTIQNPIIPLQNGATNEPYQHSNQQLQHHDNVEIPSDDEFYIIEDDCPPLPSQNNNLQM